MLNKILLSLVVTFSLFTCFNGTAKKPNDAGFKEITVTSPHTITQKVFAADILPALGKELITFVADEQGSRWLIIYALENDNQQYKIAEKTLIPQDFYRYDFTKISTSKVAINNLNSEAGKIKKAVEKPTQKLYFLSVDTLAVYQQDKVNKFKKLSAIKSLYVHDSVNYLSRGSFIQNLNDDEFDDVILADFDKTHVLIGQGLDNFAKQTLMIKPTSQIFSNGATYTETRLYFNDINFDGKTDIMSVGSGNISVYLQYKDSQFDKRVSNIPINNTIKSTDWWDHRGVSGEKLDQSNLTYRKLEELRDINADGIIDLVVRFTKASGVFDRVNDYEIYFGENIEGIITYPQEANTVIHAEGTLIGLEFDDINNDNKLEVLLSGFDIGLSQIIGALVTGAIDQDVYLFQMDDEDNFPDKPAIKKGVELTFSLSSGQSGSAVTKLADVNGDGLKDLVLSDDDDELKIYLGKAPGKDKKSFRKRKINYDTQLPKDGSSVIVEDLNGDGKDDLLMLFARLDGEGKEKQFKVLFSQ